MRGQRLGSKSHVNVDRKGSLVRLKSELSSPREVAQNLNKVKSEGGELEEESFQRGVAEDDQREEKDERSECSVEIEKDNDLQSEKVKEECCGGGDEKSFKVGEESENLPGRSKSDGNSSVIEVQCYVENQNDETNDNEENEHGRSRDDQKEQTDIEKEKVKIDAVKECSESDEDLKRCSLSNRDLKQCDGEGIARYLKSEGGITEGSESELDESAARKPQTAQMCDLFETGSAQVHPAEVDEKSDLKMVYQKRENLIGSRTAEV